jgi:hypothetical protein
MSIAVEDWDDLAAARQRRGERGQAAAPDAASDAAANVAPRDDRDDHRGDEQDYDESESENIRIPLCLAAGNIAIWLLAHLSGVVELLGVSFAASVGMLLAAYILREWQRDRSALICLVGALPLPITIFALIA